MYPLQIKTTKSNACFIKKRKPNTDRCDLSLFQLGLRLLDYFLNQEVEIPVVFNRVE
jgi:hypothetical protein